MTTITQELVHETLLTASPRYGWTAEDLAAEIYDTAEGLDYETIEAKVVGALIDMKKRGEVFTGCRDGEVRWHAVFGGAA